MFKMFNIFSKKNTFLAFYFLKNDFYHFKHSYLCENFSLLTVFIFCCRLLEYLCFVEKSV